MLTTDTLLVDIEKLPTRCFKCRKAPKNCVCFTYRVVEGDNSTAIFVDNVARDPVRGENTGTWQPRRNAKISRRPVYEDGYGPIVWTSDPDISEEIKKVVGDGTFNLDSFRNRDRCRVREFDRDNSRTLGFLRKPRRRRMGV